MRRKPSPAVTERPEPARDSTARIEGGAPAVEPDHDAFSLSLVTALRESTSVHRADGGDMRCERCERCSKRARLSGRSTGASVLAGADQPESPEFGPTSRRNKEKRNDRTTI